MTEKIIRLTVIQDTLLNIERYVEIKEFDPYKDTPQASDRFRGYGFGSFLLNIKPEEIEYDEDVLKFLKPQVNCQHSSMGDLFGFSFKSNPEAAKEEFKAPYITYGSLFKRLIVPKADCTISADIFKTLSDNLKRS